MQKDSIARYALCAALWPVLALGSVAGAQQQPHAAELARADTPDTTPQQRYRSAIREAGGGLKIGLEECRAQAQARKACEAEARARYQADMAQAREMLRNPQARPVNETGGPIRSSETVTVIRP